MSFWPNLSIAQGGRAGEPGRIFGDANCDIHMQNLRRDSVCDVDCAGGRCTGRNRLCGAGMKSRISLDMAAIVP